MLQEKKSEVVRTAQGDDHKMINIIVTVNWNLGTLRKDTVSSHVAQAGTYLEEFLGA